MVDYDNTCLLDRKLVTAFLMDRLNNKNISVISFHKEWDYIDVFLVANIYVKGKKSLKTDRVEYEYVEYLKWKSEWEQIYLRQDKIRKLNERKTS